MRIGSALNGPHQVVRVGLLAQSARVVAGGQDQRHAVVDFCDQLVGVGGDDRERADPVSSRTLTSARPGRLAHSLFREQLPGCGVVQLGQDIRDKFPSQLPAQFSERPRGTVSVNHNVVRLNRDDKIAVVTPDTNLPLCARQHGNPLLCGQAITVPGLQQRPLCE